MRRQVKRGGDIIETRGFRFGIPIVAIVVVVLLVTGVALAATVLTIDSTVTIVS